MPNVGPMEILLLAVLALLLFGPKKLPEIGRSVGKGIRELKDSLDGQTQEFRDAVGLADEDELELRAETRPPVEHDLG